MEEAGEEKDDKPVEQELLPRLNHIHNGLDIAAVDVAPEEKSAGRVLQSGYNSEVVVAGLVDVSNDGVNGSGRGHRRKVIGNIRSKGEL